MTRENLADVVQRKGHAILTATEFREVFRGGRDDVEVPIFCTKHKFSFRWVKDRAAFFRGRRLDPHLVKQIEDGEF